MIDYIEIPVEDLPRAIAFYQQVLGIHVSRGHEEGVGDYATFPQGHTALTVVLVETPRVVLPRATSVQVYFRIRGSVAEAARRARTAGGRVVGDVAVVPRIGSVQFVRDPDGHRIGLRSNTL